MSEIATLIVTAVSVKAKGNGTFFVSIPFECVGGNGTFLALTRIYLKRLNASDLVLDSMKWQVIWNHRDFVTIGVA